MEFRILGVLEALENGLLISLGGPKQRSVLAMLLLDANRSVSTDRLVDGLWGDNPPQRAAATLHVYVSNLRKALEPDRSPRAEPSVLLTQPPGYLLAVDPGQVDLFRFEQLIGIARSLWADGCIAGAAVLFQEALAQWREAPLADLASEPFASFEVPRLEEARTGAIEDRVDADLALGRAVELLPELEALVARNPYRERLRRQFMLALYRAGRQADALAAYQAARQVLVDELGLEPGRELREMEAAILVHEPALAPVELAPIGADAAARVLQAVNRAEPDAAIVGAIVQAGCHSARRAEEALRRAVDREQTSRLSATLEVAGATQVELTRARRVIADRVLDRRRRRAPRPTTSDRGAPHGPRSRTAGEPCPYKGLLRFEPEDAAWYFGRERLVAELLASVASTRCTGVVGASGSGKSSLTRAGLLAALRDDALPGSAEWPRLLVTPGADPMLELARALTPACHAASPDQVRDRLLEEPESLSAFAARATNGLGRDASVVIVVDQLEEVFTVCRDDSVRERFLDVLVHGASDSDSPTRILAAIRADYYGRCAEHAAFAELLGQASVLVGPMRPDELQRAIEEPARLAGLVIEDGLVDRIFDDVGTEPGSLPLLETALLETWTRRSGHTLTLDGYAASGGVRGAVAHLADEVYARMSSSDQDIARGIFLRLAEPGVGTDDVRRRAPLEELVVDDDHGAVLATLVEHRLVVTGDVTAEVAHEALLRAWPRLRAWLEEDREGRRVHRALSNAAQEWATGERDDDLLFRGSRLAAALDVADAHPAEINPVEREFLDAGAERERIEEDDLRAQAHAQARSNRRLRRSLTAVALLLVCALIAGAVAIGQFARAADERDRAEASSRRIAVRNLVSQSLRLRDTRRDLAALLAVAAYRFAPGPETESALFATFTGSPGFAGHLRGGEHLYRSGAFLPGGRRLAIVDAAGELRIFDTDRLTEIERVTVSSARALHAVIAVSTDGSTLAVGSDTGVADAPGELRVLDSATLRASFDAVRLDFPVRSLAVSPDGGLAAVSGGDDARVEIRDARTGALVVRVDAQRLAANTPGQMSTAGLAFSAPDRLVVASQAGSVQTLDAYTGETLATIAGPPDLAGPSGCCPLRAGWVVRLTADGRSAVTSGPAGTMRWDLATGRAAWPQPASQSCRSFTIAEASSAVICGVGFARTVALDLETGVTRAERYGGSQSSVDDLAISADGRVLAVIGGFDAQGPLQGDTRATAAIWRLDGAGPIHRTVGSGRLVVFGKGYDPAGKLLLVGAPQGAVGPLTSDGIDLKVMDPNTGATVDELDGILAAAWSGRPGKLTGLFTDGTNGFYDVTRHARLTSSPNPGIIPNGVLPDPAHGRLILWDNAGHVRASKIDGSPTSPTFDIPPTTPAPWSIGWRLVISPDGRTLVGASLEHGLQSFDVATGRRVAGPLREYLRVVMSPNGEAVAWTAANRVAIFDPATLEPLSDALPASFGPIFNLLFSSDGPRMVVYSPAGTYQLVDWPSRTSLGDPIAWGAGVPTPWSFVDLRADGLQLAFPGSEGITVWDLDRDTWIDRACALAGRDLTPAEWQQYLGAFGPQTEMCT